MLTSNVVGVIALYIHDLLTSLYKAARNISKFDRISFNTVIRSAIITSVDFKMIKAHKATKSQKKYEFSHELQVFYVKSHTERIDTVEEFM